MSQESERRRTGRPVEHNEVHKRTTIELPVSILQYLETVKPNRTKWVIDAIREKIERENEANWLNESR